MSCLILYRYRYNCARDAIITAILRVVTPQWLVLRPLMRNEKILLLYAGFYDGGERGRDTCGEKLVKLSRSVCVREREDKDS